MSAASPEAFLRAWYPWAFLSEFVAVYPVYALMFEDHGLAPAAIASLFMVWALAAFVLEIPSGAVSDRYPRHRVLAAGYLLKAAGFGAWFVAPGYAGYLVGFLLWGAGGALASGTREALVHEHLDRCARAADFQRVWGRTRALQSAGGTLALASGGALALGGYDVPLVLSILVCAIAALIAERAFALPATPAAGAPPPASVLALLRTGVGHALGDGAVRRAVAMLATTVAVINAYEEFTPLFLREAGAGLVDVGLLFALVYVGHIAGAAFAARVDPGTRHGDARIPLATAATCGLLLAIASQTDGVAGVAMLVAAFAAWGVFDVGLATRLQQVAGDDARATVTSVAALGETACALAVYAAIGAVSGPSGWISGTYVAGIALLVVGTGWLLATVPPPAVPGGGSGGPGAPEGRS
jgi:MFS family permease